MISSKAVWGQCAGRSTGGDDVRRVRTGIPTSRATLDSRAFAVQVSTGCLEAEAFINSAGSNFPVFDVEYDATDSGAADTSEDMAGADVGQPFSTVIGVREDGAEGGELRRCLPNGRSHFRSTRRTLVNTTASGRTDSGSRVLARHRQRRQTRHVQARLGRARAGWRASVHLPRGRRAGWSSR